MADQKTEKPTQRRLDKSREEGQFASAKEFVAALQFLVFLGLLSAGGAHWFAQFRLTTRSLLRLAFRPDLRAEDLIHIAYQVFNLHILPIVIAAMALVVATLFFRLLTTRFGFSLKKLMPDAARFNPMAKLKSMI